MKYILLCLALVVMATGAHASGGLNLMAAMPTAGGIPPASCPQGSTYPDGCAGNPNKTKTPQYPSLLASYVVRPPWNVPAVDQYVGLDTSLTLSDWTTLGAGQHVALTGSAGGGGVQGVTCNANSSTDIVLDKVDFTLHQGAGIFCGAGSAKSLTVTNAKFGCSPVNNTGPNAVAFFQIQDANIPVTVRNSTFNFHNCNGMGDSQIVNTFGSVTFEYNFAENSTNPAEALNNGGGGQGIYAGTQGAAVTVLSRFNYFGDENNQGTGAHNNYQQWAILNSSTTSTWSFNTGRQSVNSVAADQGGEFTQWYGNTSGRIGTAVLTFNTMICTVSLGHTTCSNFSNGGQPVSGGTVDTNYCDDSGTFIAFYPGSMTPAAGWNPSSTGLHNGKPCIRMTTGATINPT
jgi:hypothetical protein